MQWTLLASIFQGIFNPSNADITIQTTNGPIQVHSEVGKKPRINITSFLCILTCILVSTWSNQFKIMLEAGMSESTSKCIEILHEESDHVKSVWFSPQLKVTNSFKMISYMYSAKVLLDQSNAIPLLRLGSYYQIESLRYYGNIWKVMDIN